MFLFSVQAGSQYWHINTIVCIRILIGFFKKMIYVKFLPLIQKKPKSVNKKMIHRSKELRRLQTPSEDRLWTILKGRRFFGYKFRRQKIIGCYIVDFVCLDTKIIIELDGMQHLEQKDYDQNRTAFLESLGFKIVRFWNNELVYGWPSVLNRLYNACRNTQDGIDVLVR